MKNLLLKNLLLPVVALAAVIPAHARTLSPEEALGRLSAGSAKMPAAVMPSVASSRLLLTERMPSGQPAVYVFENEASRQMLFVSADDVALPLLGYSDGIAENAAVEMPPQLRWWLGEYARQIAAVQSGEATTVAAESRTSQPVICRAVSAERHEIKPMVTTKWNQGAPYNISCPSSSNGQAVTGCVATAMAQMMNYFKYPEKGTGTVSATFENNTYSLDLSTITFDWDNMLDDYSTSTSGTGAQRTAVANLMKACGYSVKMSYGTDESGAVSSNITSALINNFGYDAGGYFADRDYYSLAAWEDLIYNNLRDFGPICYSGRSTTGGHSFVCDGYSYNGYFHFNWGWGGMYNGYFTLQAMNPDGAGIGGFAGGYNFMQGASLGICRPRQEGAVSPWQLTSDYGVTGSYDSANGRLTYSGGFYNYSEETRTFDIYAKFVPTDGSDPIRKKILTTAALQHYYGYSNIWNSPYLDEGTYDVYVETTRPDDTETYYPLVVPVSCPDHFRITKSGGEYSIENYQAASVSIDFKQLITEIPYVSSRRCIAGTPEMSFTVSNNSDCEAAGGVGFQIFNGDPADNGTLIACTTGSFFDLTPGESADFDSPFEISLYRYPSLNVEYNLYFYDPNIDALPTRHTTSQKVGTVKFVEYPGCSLSVSNPSIDGDADNVWVYSVPIKGTLSCNSGFYNYFLRAAVFDADYNYVTEGDIATLNVKNGESQDFKGVLTNISLEPSTDYNLALYQRDFINGGYKQITPPIGFHTVSQEVVLGIDEVTPDAEGRGVQIAFDGMGRELSVAAAAGVGSVAVFSVSGAQTGVTVNYTDVTASADLSKLPAGVYVVRATDCAGNIASEKIVLR